MDLITRKKRAGSNGALELAAEELAIQKRAEVHKLFQVSVSEPEPGHKSDGQETTTPNESESPKEIIPLSLVEGQPALLAQTPLVSLRMFTSWTRAHGQERSFSSLSRAETVSLQAFSAESACSASASFPSLRH